MRALEVTLSDDQAALRASIRQYLTEHEGPRQFRRRESGDGTGAAESWRRIARELQLTGLPVPDSLGGQGASWFEVCLAFEEMGESFYSGPFFSTVGLAINLLLAAQAGAARDHLLTRFCDGATGTVALTREFGLGRTQLITSAHEDRWALTGEVEGVIDGATADVILVAASYPEGIGIFAIEPNAPGVELTQVPAFDVGRPVATLSLRDVLASPIDDRAVEPLALKRALARAQVALAHEQVGGMQACLEMAVSYSKDRFQFGRPIGSFQVIKHKCAEMLTLVETARAMVQEQAVVISDADARLDPCAIAAFNAFCADAYVHCASDCIQIHGAIGFTWEHDAHLFYRRAIAGKELLGDPRTHRMALAALLFDGGPTPLINSELSVTTTTEPR